MSVINGLNLYNKLNEISKSRIYTKRVKICFMTLSVINYKY